LLIGCYWLLKVLLRRKRRKRLVSQNAKGKVAVITGAASGIGKVSALLLASKGWRVFAIDINEAGLQDLEAEGKKKNLTILSKTWNLAAAETIPNLVEAISKELPNASGIDALINCAGIAFSVPTLGASLSQVELQFKVNVVAPYILSKEFLDLLLAGENGGTIVNVSSVGGLWAWPWQGAYASTKFALEGLSDTIRREAIASGLNLRVCLVEPGGVDTPLASAVVGNTTNWLENNKDSSFASGVKLSLERLENSYKYISPKNRAILASPMAVAENILIAATDKNPQQRYYVAAPVFHVLFCSLYYAPTVVSDWMSSFIC